MVSFDSSIPGIITERYPDTVPYPQDKPFITTAQVQKILRKAGTPRCAQLADLFNELAPQYGLNRPQVFHEYIAQCAVESNEYTDLQENLNYSAGRLVAVWPKRFPSLAYAKPYAGNPVKLANKVYANRMGNGDENSGDGYANRGQGAIQLTGKDMYIAFAKYKGVDVSNVREYIGTDLRWAVDSSMWLFVVKDKLLDEAEKDEFLTITKAINPAALGEIDRERYYHLAESALPIS